MSTIYPNRKDGKIISVSQGVVLYSFHFFNRESVDRLKRIAYNKHTTTHGT